jgi:hypothetical protein
MFLSLQEQMVSSLTTSREIIRHPTSKGDATELQWLTMLNNHLPERYRADKAFVLDCEGRISEQIDVVIYDRQYSPFLFNQNNTKFIPAESVYGVFEVRQELSSGNLKYAGAKAATVRALRRTSAPISHAGGKFAPKEPLPIIAGILCLGSEWIPPFGDPFRDALSSLGTRDRLDLGCALEFGAFEVEYLHGKGQKATVTISRKETTLIFFLFRLLAQLQRLGTVSAIDLGEYGRAL